MKRAFVLIVLFAAMAWSQTVIAPKGTQFYKFTPAPSAPLAELPPPEGDDDKDPAYKTYKEGYSLILDEKWAEAMKKFAEVKSKFSKSDYLDDAAYWNAYAQKRLDKKKGIEAYELFIENYPESSYIDDAVSDMSDGDVTVTVSGDTKNVRVRTPRPGSYSYSYGSTSSASAQAMRDAERSVRQAQRELRHSGLRTPLAPLSMAWSGFDERDEEKKLDKKTRMKLAALRALAESENDEKAFAALKEVALDRSQPRIMRVTAVQSLGDFNRFDIIPTLVEIAKGDPDEDVREYAIYSIGDASKDKNKTVDHLITIFNSTPKGKEKQLESVLYVIADVGNDKAVDFLVKVATTYDDDLGNNAVYYLGNIGNEKSRAALMRILKEK